MDIPVPVELWIPDQDWLESTEMTVGQSEWPEAADVSELHRQKEKVVRLWNSLRSNVSPCFVSGIQFTICFQHSHFLHLFHTYPVNLTSIYLTSIYIHTLIFYVTI